MTRGVIGASARRPGAVRCGSCSRAGCCPGLKQDSGVSARPKAGWEGSPTSSHSGLRSPGSRLLSARS